VGSEADFDRYIAEHNLPEVIDFTERRALIFRQAAGYLELELRSYGHGSGTTEATDPA
jgi:hypothetical protein